MLFSVFAQFELEKIDESEEDEEFFEEEYAEEEVLIEDRAGITPDSPFYFVDEVIEDINLAVRKGEDKADYALKVAEEKVAEAKLMVEKNKSAETEKALKKANNVSKIVEQEVSPDMGNETNERMESIKKILKEMEEQIPADWGEIKDLIDAQTTQADKTKVAVELAGKIGDLCEKLARQDWELMQAEPRCDIDNAPGWLDEYIGDELKGREEDAKEGIMDGMAQCITDPRECDCSKIPVKSHRKMCEKAIPLAIKCEFEFNQRACDELDLIEVPEGFEDKEFTEHIREKEKKMFDKFAPPECREAGLTTKEDCEELMFEMYGPPPDECMEDGEFIGPMRCQEIMEEIYGPTPEECLDDDGRFIGEAECMDIMMPDKCKEAGATTEEECMDIMMPPECKEAGATTKDECEEIMDDIMGGPGGPMPEECIEAGITSGEECGELMEELYGPTDPACLDENGKFIGDELCIAAILPECAEAGGTTWEDCEEFFPEEGGEGEGGLPQGCIENGDYIGKDECDEVIWDMMGRPPAECFEDGEFIGGDYCKELTGKEYGGAPFDECVDGIEYVGHEECGEIMGWGEDSGTSPPECVENGKYIGDEECMQKTDPGCASLGVSNWDECHNIMREKYGMSPDECFEGEGMGFVGELKCAVIIEEQYGKGEGEGGYGTAPAYCYDEDGEYVGDEECSRRNDEHGGGGPPGEGGEGPGPADYCYDEDGEYVGDEECTDLNAMRIIEEGVVADYCFDENYDYIGNDACSALNDEHQEEQIEELYDEIDNLEGDLEGEEFDDWEEIEEDEEEIGEDFEGEEIEGEMEEEEEFEEEIEEEPEEEEEFIEEFEEEEKEEEFEEEETEEVEEEFEEEKEEEVEEDSGNEITGEVIKVPDSKFSLIEWFSGMFGN